MKDDSHAIAGHYGRADLGAVILAALAATGKDVDRLTPDDLEPVDQLHSRGRTATVDLAALLALDGHERILDLGCGIGGPSRYLAESFGCRVTGLDLTPEFCRVAAMLAERTGLADKVDYRVGDALAMPFPAESFDVVWSQSVAMNIADRDRPPHFPVPWARDASISFLRSAEATRRGLEAAGFRLLVFEDLTADALERAQARMKASGAPLALGLHIVLGQDGPAMLKNMARNYEERRIGLVQGIAVRPE